MKTIAPHILPLLDDTSPGSGLHRLATLVLQQMAGEPGIAAYDDAFVEQALHGFARVLREDLEDGDGEVRRLFFETTIPAALGTGRSLPSMLRSATMYLTLVGMHLAATVPAEHRDATVAWFSTFAGDYVRDLHDAGTRGPS